MNFWGILENPMLARMGIMQVKAWGESIVKVKVSEVKA